MAGDEQKRRVVVFGIFDGVHEGHRDFFRQALRQAQGKLKQEVELVVVVGRDAIAEKLKGKKPKYSETERVEMLKREKLVDDAVLGDEVLSSYHVLEELNPDVICLGYDQMELAQDLEKWMSERREKVPIHCLKPHKPDIFHNSLQQG